MIRLTANPKYKNRVALYFSAMILVWCVLVLPVLLQVHVEEGREIYAFFWCFGYAFLCITTAYCFTTYVCYFFTRASKPLPELDHTPENKTVAIVCPVRNEEVGLYERLAFSLNGNTAKHIHFWLLSDSDPDQEKRERGVIARLQAEHPESKIYYRRRQEHSHFKPGNLAEWLFCRGGRHYDYFFILDADSLVKPGTIERLLRKAEHPANWDIWHFQCKTAIIHDFSYFAHIQKIALDVYERLVFPTIYSICGQWISYGHSNLLNTRGFILAMPPTDELSHDVWDAATLDRVGFRSVIVTDVMVYEEAPVNDLIARKRDKRWTQGSLSALKILGDSRVSIIQRFFVFQGAAQYINNFVFLAWILLQFWNMVTWDYYALNFPINFQLGPFAMNRTLFFSTVFSITTFIGHPFLVAKTKKDVKDYLSLILFSNITMLYNLVNGTLNVLSVFMSPLKSWAPMEKDPFAKHEVLNMIRKTLPPSFFALFLAVMAWRTDHRWWLLFTSPMVFGGILSPLICWWGGQPRRIESGPSQVRETPEKEKSLHEELVFT